MKDLTGQGKDQFHNPIYDQPLCKAARSKGIDVVVLTHMVGAFRLVSEVLDTRERVQSFGF